MARHLPPNAHAYRLYVFKELLPATAARAAEISEDDDSGTFFRAASSIPAGMLCGQAVQASGVSVYFEPDVGHC
jgi:hypothetical protein